MLEAQLMPDERQSWDVDVTAEERTAILGAIGVLREKVLFDSAICEAIQATCDFVHRSYSEDLYEAKLEMTSSQRDALDTRTRGVLYGLARAVDFLTSSRHIALLESVLSKE